MPAFVVLLLLAATPAGAQTVEPVRGFVIDFRGTTSGLPNDSAFYPALDADALVPARAFGFEAAGHVYVLTIGPSRLGVGVGYLRARGTTERVVANLAVVAPQISFNFGTINGWSYLSAGAGRAWVETAVENDIGRSTRESGGLPALNVGGGARWFLTRHAAVGFDVRLHRLSGTPRTSLLAAAVGFSVR